MVVPYTFTTYVLSYPRQPKLIFHTVNDCIAWKATLTVHSLGTFRYFIDIWLRDIGKVLLTNDNRLHQRNSRNLREIISHRILFRYIRISFCFSSLCWASIRRINTIFGLLCSSSVFLGSEKQGGLIQKLSSRRRSLRDDRDRGRDRLIQQMADHLWRHPGSLD